MNNPTSNDQLNEDTFILDRDQLQQPRQKPSTPSPNYQLINLERNSNIYEIIKTEDQHVVLVHESEPTDAINNENDNGVIRHFTANNPVFPDDIHEHNQ